MLIFSILRYHEIGIDNNRPHNLEKDTSRVSLFYNDVTLKDYCDKIAKNYKEKLPLIFGKWIFLKIQLGSILLYDSFDFLIYKKAGSQTTANSVWIGGNKEYYGDIQSLASNARYHLSPIYITGRTTFDNFQKHRDILNDLRIVPVYRKLKEIEEILNYADMPSYIRGLPNKHPFSFTSEPI